MKRPYVKEDVWIRVVRMLQRGYTYVAVANARDIGEATVNRIWRRFRQTGKTSLLARGGGTRPAITPEQQADFEKFVSGRSLETYDALTAGWSKKIGKKNFALCHRATRPPPGFYAKKGDEKSNRKAGSQKSCKGVVVQVSSEKRRPEKLVFLDESGFQVNQMARYGRSKKGQPVGIWAPAAHSKNFIRVDAIRIDGHVIMRGSSRAITRKSFFVFPTLSPFPGPAAQRCIGDG